jgi:hypothetical protein
VSEPDAPIEDAPDVTPPAEAASQKAPRGEPDWRAALRFLRRERKAVMLPLLLVLAPLSAAAGVFWAVLFIVVYPDAPYDSATAILEDGPPSLLFWLPVMSAAWALFTLVGYAAALVSARGLLPGGKRAGVSAALDVGFTRMGSLLGLGMLMYLLLVAATLLAITVIGSVLMAYVAVRLALTLNVMVFEGASLSAGLRTSWRLMRGQILRVAGYLIGAMLVGFAALLMMGIVFALVTVPFGTDPGHDATSVLNALGLVLVGLASIPALAFLSLVTTMLYLRLTEAANARTAARI